MAHVDTGTASALSDPHRMRALDATALLDTPAESAFDRLTNLASRVLGVPVALVSLVTEDRQFFKSQCGLPDPYDETRETPLSHSFCQYVVADGEPLIVSDARELERLAANLAIEDLGVVAYAGFPLVARDGSVLGSFCAIDTEPREWSPEDLDLLRELAAATMDVVELRTEAVAAAEAGRRLQRALVPEPPFLEGVQVSAVYRPGEQRLLLGGDFYFCAEQPDGSISLLIGDVAGHGPEAAAFATSLRSAWRAMLLAPVTLEEQVSRLNIVALGQQPTPGVFVTGLFCSIAADRRSVWAVNGGHPPLVLIDDAGAREQALPRNPPLGVVPELEWQGAEIALEPGAALLVYTDGLIEGRRAPGAKERLGPAPILAEAGRLRAAGADGHALLDGLVARALAANGAPLADDVAALVAWTR